MAWTGRLFSVAAAFLLLSYDEPARCDDPAAGDGTRVADIRTATVILSGLVEAYSIQANEPIPYLGLGHFLQEEWAGGFTYLSAELAARQAENHFGDAIGLRDYGNYPNSTSDSIYFKPGYRGFSPHQFKQSSYRDLASHTLFYVRLVDAYDTYRRFHARTVSTNRVKMNNERIPTLLSSPVRWKYLKNPWVNIPVVAAGIATYVFSNANRSLGDAEEIVSLERRHGSAGAAAIESGLQSYRYFMIAAGEEMYFRGVVQTELTERTNPSLAVIVSASLFGFWHIPNNGGGSAVLAGIWGSYVGYRYEANGHDIGEAIAQHFWMNFTARTIEFLRNPRAGRFVFSVAWKV